MRCVPSAEKYTEIYISDALGRLPTWYLEMNSVLITGGSGFFGTAFVKRMLTIKDGPSRIVIFSRGEHRQAEMARDLAPFDPHERLRMFIGDVRDRDRLTRAMEDVEVIFHAAALKRIETAFYNPIEIQKTNIDGAANVIEAAHDAHVQKVIALSTDKVFQPVSPYGTSKAFAESLFLAANNIRGKRGPIFAICRYGNIFCSTGSVVPTWRKMLAEGAKTVPVTDPECTRFFMTIDEAIDLLSRGRLMAETCSGCRYWQRFTYGKDLPAMKMGQCRIKAPVILFAQLRNSRPTAIMAAGKRVWWKPPARRIGCRV